MVGFRGNVATRIAKLAAGEADATLLAAAGLDRLGEVGVGTPLEPDDWLPAPAQGAIGIECRSDDTAALAWLAAIDHAPSRAEVMAERALLAALGGNCHSPIAVLTTHVYHSGADDLVMRAALLSPDGAARIERTARFAADDLEAPARLAALLLDEAEDAIARNFAGPA